VAELFELSDLAATLQADLDTASATEARRKASAWLASATYLTAWPTPVPENLRAWAIELAAMAYDNPSNLNSESYADGTSTNWAIARRAEILAEARTHYPKAGGGNKPQGAFPQSSFYPDPVETDLFPFGTGRWYVR
jgi:hypothetical protein